MTGIAFVVPMGGQRQNDVMGPGSSNTFVLLLLKERISKATFFMRRRHILRRRYGA